MNGTNPHSIDGLLDSDAIELLVVHCSDTPDDEPLRARDIQAMHLGFGWDGIGYHRVIGRDGLCEAGAPNIGAARMFAASMTAALASA
ncbi:MAG: hypothetical protein ACPG36_02120 [Candidatus Puniceispirillaceae bacterium]